MAGPHERPLGELLHEPLFVPRTTPVKRLFLTFKQKKVHMAIVVSEYGKVLGLVTMDDLLAQIFGVLRDERADLQASMPGPRRVGRTRTPGRRRPCSRYRPGAEAGRRARIEPDRGTRRVRRSVAGARADPRQIDEVTPPAIDVDELRARQDKRMITIGQLIALLVGCVLAQAFFVSAEVALSACDRNALHARAAGGKTARARAERMLAVPQVTLATTLVGANLATLVAVLVLAHRARDARRVAAVGAADRRAAAARARPPRAEGDRAGARRPHRRSDRDAAAPRVVRAAAVRRRSSAASRRR